MLRSIPRIAVCINLSALACATPEDQFESETGRETGPESSSTPAPGPTAPAPDSAAPVFDAATALEQTRELLLAQAKLEPGMIVAEIGASRGWFVDRAALAVGPEGFIYATDIDPEAIAALRELIARSDDPARARAEVRPCADPRDTGLSDLPDNHVDVMLMIDSLCFDGERPPERDVEYLREFLRVLEPGGRLIHHMDCECEAPVADAVALFEAAGFIASIEELELPQAPIGDESWTCKTPSQRARHDLLLSLRKPS